MSDRMMRRSPFAILVSTPLMVNLSAFPSSRRLDMETPGLVVIAAEPEDLVAVSEDIGWLCV